MPTNFSGSLLSFRKRRFLRSPKISCFAGEHLALPSAPMLSAGIVGLPNVGKSTLFNAVTRTRKAQAANYPFCTIDPNLGVVTVPDPRLEMLSKLSHSQKIIPAAIEFVDIAGLVKGASAGEGLGNQFLSHIREVNAIVQVVRCFENRGHSSRQRHDRPGPRHRGDQYRTGSGRSRVAPETARSIAKGSPRRIEDARRRKRPSSTSFFPISTQGSRRSHSNLSPEEKEIAREFFLLVLQAHPVRLQRRRIRSCDICSRYR